MLDLTTRKPKYGVDVAIEEERLDAIRVEERRKQRKVNRNLDLIWARAASHYANQTYNRELKRFNDIPLFRPARCPFSGAIHLYMKSHMRIADGLLQPIKEYEIPTLSSIKKMIQELKQVNGVIKYIRVSADGEYKWDSVSAAKKALRKASETIKTAATPYSVISAISDMDTGDIFLDGTSVRPLS